MRHLIALLLAVSPAAALAAEPATTPLPRPSEDQRFAIEDELAKMDTNHDGQWSKAEWLASGRLEATFDTLDHNKDGVLTRQEIRSNYSKLRMPARP